MTNAEQKLFRSDLLTNANDQQRQALSFLRNEEFVQQLQYIDSWSDVPENWAPLNGQLAQVRSYVDQYVNALDSSRTLADISQRRDSLVNMVGSMNQPYNTIKNNDYLRRLFTLERLLAEASHLPDTIARLDKRFDTLEKAVGATTTKFDADANKSLSTIEEIARGAKTAEEKTKHALEQAKTHFADQAMTGFAHAFADENDKAQKHADTAWSWAVKAVVIAVGVLFITMILDAFSSTDVIAWKWVSIRVALTIFLGSLAAYFMRERRNFLHIAVANRHRRNLCNAYLAIAESMKEKERLAYLKAILPHLSALGKTGFIAKEEAVDMPTETIVKAVSNTIQEKAKKTI